MKNTNKLLSYVPWENRKTKNSPSYFFLLLSNSTNDQKYFKACVQGDEI